jgi:hypothetical protein
MKGYYSSLFDLLKNEPKIVINKIYSTAATSVYACQAIFQSLSPLTRYLIMRFLFLHCTIKLSEIFLIINKAPEDQIRQVFDELLDLDIIIEAEGSGREEKKVVDSSFSKNGHHTKSQPTDLVDLTGSGPLSPVGSSFSSSSSLRRFSQNHTLYRMNPSFQKALIQAITNTSLSSDASTTSSSASVLTPIKVENILKVSPQFLEEYRINEWNKVLSYLVGLINENDFSAKIIPLFMSRYGLIMKLTAGTNPSSSSSSSTSASSNLSNKPSNMITSKGYEFLLKDYYHQVWEYVVEALSHQNKEENMSLLFMLSYATYGEAYSTQYLTTSQNLFLFELSQVGIVYLPSIHSKYFYPTHTMINLIFGANAAAVAAGASTTASSSSSLSSSASLQRQPSSSSLSALPSIAPIQNYFTSPILASNTALTVKNEEKQINNATNSSQLSIKLRPTSSISSSTSTALINIHSTLTIIVETNLQVIAYVTSDLHVALLRLFIDISIRLPNMAIGRITRDKAKEAFSVGMKSAQIVDFLTIHAHTISKTRVKIIPENVIDQLILWESELERVQSTESLLIDFSQMIGMSKELYQRLVEHLNQLNLILWENHSKYCFICDPTAQSIIHSFLTDHQTMF